MEVAEMKLYVGNLSFDATENEIRELFGQYGEVSEVNLITDRETGRPRGFGFVEIQPDPPRSESIAVLQVGDEVMFGERNLIFVFSVPKRSSE